MGADPGRHGRRARADTIHRRGLRGGAFAPGRALPAGRHRACRRRGGPRALGHPARHDSLPDLLRRRERHRSQEPAGRTRSVRAGFRRHQRCVPAGEAEPIRTQRGAAPTGRVRSRPCLGAPQRAHHRGQPPLPRRTLALRKLRRLGLVASRRGPRPAPDGGHVARPRGGRHGVVRQHRLHDRRELLRRTLRTGADREHKRRIRTRGRPRRATVGRGRCGRRCMHPAADTRPTGAARAGGPAGRTRYGDPARQRGTCGAAARAGRRIARAPCERPRAGRCCESCWRRSGEASRGRQVPSATGGRG